MRREHAAPAQIFFGRLRMRKRKPRSPSPELPAAKVPLQVAPWSATREVLKNYGIERVIATAGSVFENARAALEETGQGDRWNTEIKRKLAAAFECDRQIQSRVQPSPSSQDAAELLNSMLTKVKTSILANRLAPKGIASYRSCDDLYDELNRRFPGKLNPPDTKCANSDFELSYLRELEKWLLERLRLPVDDSAPVTRDSLRSRNSGSDDPSGLSKLSKLLESNPCLLDSLAPKIRHTLEQYCLTAANDITLATDEAVYNRLQENGADVPSYETWGRNLRRARKAIGLQKNKPRSDRSGRSVVRADEV